MKRTVKRHKWCIVLAAAVAVTALMYLWMAFRPPLWYYRDVLVTPHELPTRLVRPAFRSITGRDIPRTAEGLRAVFGGGRDPSIFVRFRTDSEGVSHIREQLAPSGGEFEPFSGTPQFHIVSSWQERFGIRILDRRVIESGLKLDYVVISGVSLRITIDTQHNNVQIRASRK
ncbi:MAG: hypothetical protein ACYSWW_15330 [Planctomycetota bacterium]|jgi:hypothetical protein